VPDDAVAVMGVTEVDLYPDPDWNFVYGQASYEDHVGISSMARDGEGGADLTLFRRRAFTTTVHEVGHMLGLAHCVAWECAMNGSNHRAEADSRPLEPCPACLAKLQRAVGFEPRARWAELEVAYAAAGLHDGAGAARESLRRTSPDAGR
jgi:archaemetzincin